MQNTNLLWGGGKDFSGTAQAIEQRELRKEQSLAALRNI